MKQLRNPADLPNWFNLKHYMGLEHFTAVEWYQVIYQRYMHDHLAESLEERYKNKKVYKHLEMIRDDPLILTTDTEDIKTLSPNPSISILLAKDTKKFSELAHSISPMTFGDFFYTEHLLDQKSLKKMNRCFEEQAHNPDKMKPEDYEWAKKSLEMPVYDYLRQEKRYKETIKRAP